MKIFKKHQASNDVCINMFYSNPLYFSDITLGKKKKNTRKQQLFGNSS